MFGATERLARSVARSAAGRERVARWLQGTDGPPAVVFTGPSAVAWVTGGVAPPVDRTAAVDLVWAVVSRSGAALVTTQVEHRRILEEYDASGHGFDEIVAVPWWSPDAFIVAAEDLAGAPAERLASDGHPSFGIDARTELISMRLALSDPEQDDLRSLAADAADALQSALRAWTPGERDVEVQARVCAELETRGADTPVLIVGGDERLRRYRHPLAAGVPMHDIAMAVVVARRGGLHAAATRFASAGPLDPELSHSRERVLQIDRDVVAACRPGATYGDALRALDGAYAHRGAPRGWAGHYQGGPIGYAQREFEIAPDQTDSLWYGREIELGHAVAWNPSVPGGAKVEDTYLVTTVGNERVTDAGGWPLEPNDDAASARPAVLDVTA
jgi:Xaa-Pro aminopeptidase